ncbi:hypothetical protein KCP70_20790 [Salmonella enterica subsp. enterica]|nr:hypothetical protein KCP70_20790 [Salmonella enterica subsp. enterica]
MGDDVGKLFARNIQMRRTRRTIGAALIRYSVPVNSRCWRPVPPTRTNIYMVCSSVAHDLRARFAKSLRQPKRRCS